MTTRNHILSFEELAHSKKYLYFADPRFFSNSKTGEYLVISQTTKLDIYQSFEDGFLKGKDDPDQLSKEEMDSIMKGEVAYATIFTPHMRNIVDRCFFIGVDCYDLYKTLYTKGISQWVTREDDPEIAKKKFDENWHEMLFKVNDAKFNHFYRKAQHITESLDVAVFEYKGKEN